MIKGIFWSQNHWNDINRKHNRTSKRHFWESPDAGSFPVRLTGCNDPFFLFTFHFVFCHEGYNCDEATDCQDWEYSTNKSEIAHRFVDWGILWNNYNKKNADCIEKCKDGCEAIFKELLSRGTMKFHRRNKLLYKYWNSDIELSNNH